MNLKSNIPKTPAISNVGNNSYGDTESIPALIRERDSLGFSIDSLIETLTKLTDRISPIIRQIDCCEKSSDKSDTCHPEETLSPFATTLRHQRYRIQTLNQEFVNILNMLEL